MCHSHPQRFTYPHPLLSSELFFLRVWFSKQSFTSASSTGKACSLPLEEEPQWTPAPYLAQLQISKLQC